MNMKYIAISLLSLTLLSAPASAHHVPSHLHDVTVKVNGLVCDFCAQSIIKLFEKDPTVHKVDVNFDAKEIALDFKSGSTLKNEDITKVIDYAGYSVVEIIR
jgi:copper chaperone CopZ